MVASRYLYYLLPVALIFLLLGILFFPRNEAPPALTNKVLGDVVIATSQAEPMPASPRPAARHTSEPPRKSVRPDRETGLSAIHAKLLAGLSSDNPYAAAVELRNMGTRGSFAAAHYLSQECRQAYVAAKVALRFGLGTPDETLPLGWALGRDRPATQSAQRSHAAQAIMARCQPFVDDPAAGQPLLNDLDGAAYLDAWSMVKLTNTSALPLQRAQALVELGRQGMLLGDDAIVMLAIGSRFQGKSFAAEHQAEFEAALALARYQLIMDPGAGGHALQALYLCLKFWACDTGNEPEKALWALWPGDPGRIDRAKTRALAQRMRSSMERGAISDFFKP